MPRRSDLFYSVYVRKKIYTGTRFYLVILYTFLHIFQIRYDLVRIVGVYLENM